MLPILYLYHKKEEKDEMKLNKFSISIWFWSKFEL